jgi:hypothetical protein
LEFSLQTVVTSDGKSTMTSESDPSELVLSLSDKVSEMTKTISIEPKSQARFYVWLCPNAKTLVGEAGKVELKDFSVNINCRLVKDFQHTIRVIGTTCRYPDLHIDVTELTFHGSISVTDDGSENYKINYFQGQDQHYVNLRSSPNGSM